MQVRELAHPGRVFEQIMRLAVGLASRALVHCDFNEFNLLVRAPPAAKAHTPPAAGWCVGACASTPAADARGRQSEAGEVEVDSFGAFANPGSGKQVDEEERVTLIDFPQMVSTAHPNAAELYQRDVDCIARFFARKLGYLPERDPDAPAPAPCFEVRGVSAVLPGNCPQRHPAAFTVCAGGWSTAPLHAEVPLHDKCTHTAPCSSCPRHGGLRNT